MKANGSVDLMLSLIKRASFVKVGMWERVTRPFESALSFTAVGEEAIEGRSSHRYQLVFSGVKDVQAGLKPESIEGDIWVDLQTAVRLLGDIRAQLTSEGYTKVMSTKLSRTDINTLEPIKSPDAPQVSPELLRFMQPKPLPEKSITPKEYE